MTRITLDKESSELFIAYQARMDGIKAGMDIAVQQLAVALAEKQPQPEAEKESDNGEQL